MKTMIGIAAVTLAVSTSSLLAQEVSTGASAEVSRSARILEKQISAQETEVPRKVNGLSTRSWTTTVGWRPGASAFPNAITHENGLTLFTLRARDK